MFLEKEKIREGSNPSTRAPFYERVSLVAQNTYMIFNFCLNRAAKYRYRIFNAETLVRIQDTLTFFYVYGVGSSVVEQRKTRT